MIISLMKKISVIASLLITTCTISAHGLSNKIEPDYLLPRYTKNYLKHTYSVPTIDKVDGIVVKFKEGTGVRFSNGKLKIRQAKKLRSKLPKGKSSWGSVQQDLDFFEQNITRLKLNNIKSLFQKDEVLLEDMKLRGEKHSKKELADLNLYYHFTFDKNTTQIEVEDILTQLNNNGIIEIAYANPIPENASLPKEEQCPILMGCEDLPPSGGGGGASSTPNYQSKQGYLRSASQGGIDAEYAWTKAGGSGGNIKVVDIEFGWNFAHEDLNSAFSSTGSNSSNNNHGTAVIGVMGGRNNSFGIKGTSYDAQFGFSGQGSSLVNQIINASNTVGNGGVVIIEMHAPSGDNQACSCNTPQCNYVAMEYWQATFDAIQTATALGVTIVEAAGNGTVDFDSNYYGNLFDRNVRDSGAIIVGASTSTNHYPMCWTNHGGRVDLHGWGENVTTAGYGDLYNNGPNKLYTDTFSGTSSATPIVAGAVINLQGYKKAKTGDTLTPALVRSHLVSTGTAQASSSKNIGPMPDLRDAIDTPVNTSFLGTPILSSTFFLCYGDNHLKWDPIAGSTEYQIFINTSGLTPSEGATYTQSATGRLVYVNQNSYAWVKSCNADGCSELSNKVILRHISYCF